MPATKREESRNKRCTMLAYCTSVSLNGAGVFGDAFLKTCFRSVSGGSFIVLFRDSLAHTRLNMALAA